MVVDGQVVARPMMYIALTYDHRIVDGKEAVLTLVSIKESLEDPARLVLQNMIPIYALCLTAALLRGQAG